MRWITLELRCSAEISDQVDTVINTYTTLQRQLTQRRASNPSQVERALAVLRRSFSDRLKEMAVFYRENDLDPRSSAVEAARLKLKRFLHTLDTSKASTELTEESPSLRLSRESRMPRKVGGIAGDREATGGMVSERTKKKKEGEETITIRIILTDAEHREILERCEAVRQLKMDSLFYAR